MIIGITGIVYRLHVAKAGFGAGKFKGLNLAGTELRPQNNKTRAQEKLVPI